MMTAEQQQLLQDVIKNLQQGNFENTKLSLALALDRGKISPDIFFELGITLAKVKKFKGALTVLNFLQLHKKNDLRIPYNLGLIHSLMGEHNLALEAYDLALQIQPNDTETLINKSSTYNDVKEYLLALEVLDTVIGICPIIPEAWMNRGIALNNLNLYKDSLSAYNEAIQLKPNYYEAWSNKSIPLYKLMRFSEAADACDRALSLKPDFADAWSNKGNALYELERYDEAIIHYERALSLKPDFADAWSNKGNVLYELERYDEAIIHYEKALSLKPDIDWVYGRLLYTKMKISNWSKFEFHLQHIIHNVASAKRVIDPFPLLAFVDDSSVHQRSSEILIQSKFPFNPILGKIAKHSKKQKIRIGYFSADFKNHPVAFLIAELFELHNKTQFEFYAFSLTYTKDEMRQRLIKSFDHFIDVENKSDIEIAQLSRELSIDIAIDLSGFTKDSRTGIFSYRAAPIQVNYLGYPGTTGSHYYDYIIADTTIIPPQSQRFFTEKVVYLPNSFQVNDRKRLISKKQFTKHELGLPENTFIFCCFNNNYKILPEVFNGWMRILQAVEDSVLWLFEDNSISSNNLKREASSQGINPNRLVFAKKMPLADHLARHRLADLFLDTKPYNAHTTASDALWADLPILTLMGKTFASRVAASLLNAIGIPELITNTQAEYEEKAIALANNPEKLLAIKKKLSANRTKMPLFDAPLFSKNIEAAFIQMYDRYQSDLSPDHLFVT